MGEFSHHYLSYSSLSFLKVWIHPHIFPWLLPLMQASLNGSIWSTVSVTVINNLMVTWSWIEMAKQGLNCKIIQPRWSVTSQWSTLTTGSASYRAPSTSCRWSCSPWSGTSAGPSLAAETLTNLPFPQVCRAGHLFHRAVSGAGGLGWWWQHNGAGKELDLRHGQHHSGQLAKLAQQPWVQPDHRGGHGSKSLSNCAEEKSLVHKASYPFPF